MSLCGLPTGTALGPELCSNQDLKKLLSLRLAKKPYLYVFTKSIRDSLLLVTQAVQARRFLKWCRIYVLVYDTVSQEAGAFDVHGTTPANRNACRILYQSDNQIQQEEAQEASQPRANKAGGQPKTHFECCILATGSMKWHIIRSQEEEDTKVKWMAWFNKDVDVASQQRELLVHQSQLDTGAGFINSKGGLYFLEDMNRVL
jgi:hypothetical protein